jgi:hypothetical protein
LDHREIPSTLLGEWDYETINADPDKPTHCGTFLIQLKEDDLIISGDYKEKEGEKLIGNVHSQFAAWRSGHLYFSYNVTVTLKEGADVAVGLCELIYFPSQNKNELVGNWYRLHSQSAGTINMHKKQDSKAITA